MPAVHAMIAEVEGALLLLTKSVVMFVYRRVEDCGDTKAGVVLRSCIRRSAIGPVGNHRPVSHGQEFLARSCCDGNDILVPSIPVPAAEVVVSQGLIQIVERHGMRQSRLRQMISRDADDQLTGAKDIVAVRTLLMGPSGHRRCSDK